MQARGGDGRGIDHDDNDPFDATRTAKPVVAVDPDELRDIVEHIERHENEKRAITKKISTIKTKAKGAGYLVPVINFLVRERRKDPDDMDEFNTIKEEYRRALGD